jgi:hypothetical protein
MYFKFKIYFNIKYTMYKRTIVISSLGDITEQIEQENHADYKTLAEESKMLKEIFNDLSLIANQGREPLENINNTMENTIHNTTLGTKNLIRANNTKKKINKKIIILSSIGTIVGGVIGAGIGSIFNVPGITIGAYIGVICGSAVGGSIIGTTLGVVTGTTISKI